MAVLARDVQRSSLSLVGDLLPILDAQVAEVDKLDRFVNGKPPTPRMPADRTTAEMIALGAISGTPWGRLVISSTNQGLSVEGYRSTDKQGRPSREQSEAWSKVWQPNGLDARQIAITFAALAHGESYATVMPGKAKMPPFGKMPVVRGVSARRMATIWGDTDDDEFPMWAIQTGDSAPDAKGERRRLIRIFTDQDVIFLDVGEDGSKPRFIESRHHGIGVVPVVRFPSSLDLEGQATGEIAPFISVFQRIDQDTFDRLVAQRYGVWALRWIAGMQKPANEDEEKEMARALRLTDVLVSGSADTKFGSIPGTPLDPYIAASDADIRTLAAVTQTPPHHLLGQMANLSAEALAAAEASLMRKVEERRRTFGESWERVMRLGSHLAGLEREAADFTSQVRWRDTESRSLSQAADALGKMAQQLQVPVEMLWERIPGWTSQDTEDAKKLLEEQQDLGKLMAEFGLDQNAGQNGGDQNTPEQKGVPGAQPAGALGS